MIGNFSGVPSSATASSVSCTTNISSASVTNTSACSKFPLLYTKAIQFRTVDQQVDKSQSIFETDLLEQDEV
jgi:hypothetical protein